MNTLIRYAGQSLRFAPKQRKSLNVKKANSLVVKRSVSIDGHNTSVSMEGAFWLALKDIAKRQRLTTSELIAKIDRERETNNLSSVLRVFVFKSARPEREFENRVERTQEEARRLLDEIILPLYRKRLEEAERQIESLMSTERSTGAIIRRILQACVQPDSPRAVTAAMLHDAAVAFNNGSRPRCAAGRPGG